MTEKLFKFLTAVGQELSLLPGFRFVVWQGDGAGQFTKSATLSPKNKKTNDKANDWQENES